jgi:hypothetical protein
MKTLIPAALKYFTLFIVLYGLLTAVSLVPKVGETCNRIYRQPTTTILSKMLPKAYIQMKGEGDYFETLRIEFASKAVVQQQMAIAKKTGQPMANITGTNNLVNFQNLFLSYFLFYAVLVLLSPINWKQKTVSLLVGTVLFYIYTVFKLYLILLIFFNQPDIAIEQTDATTLQIYKNIRFCMTMGTNGLLVLLLWALLVLKKNNWMGLLGEQGA